MSPDFKVQRDTNRFFCLGMDLNRPVDELKQLKYALLKNVRAYQTGRLEARKGLTLVGTVDGAVHSIRRLNVPRTGAWTRVIGSGSNLSIGQGPFTQLDTGYSGNPLALVPYRPSQSPDPWMYVMDSNKHIKVDVNGTLHSVGLPPPIYAPVLPGGRGAFLYKLIYPPVMNDVGWSGGPQFVGAMFGTSTVVATTVLDIIYDSGSTGWCTIQPGVMTGIANNMFLKIGTGYAIVDKISNGFTNPSTIQAIATLPNGTSSIVLTDIQTGIEAGGLIENTTKGSSTQIESVVTGSDAAQTIICSGAETWEVGDTVYVRSSIRCWTGYTFSEGDAIQCVGLDFGANNAKDTTLPLTGYACSPKVLRDFSTIATGVPTTPDSYITINISLTDPQDVVSVQVMLGCTNTAVQEDKFATDYFYATFTPDQLGTANGLKIKLSEFLPVGNPTWKSIYYFQLEVTLRSPINESERENQEVETHAIFHSIYLAGGSGPDTGTLGSGYRYRYRARVSSTGVVSNWSPATVEEYDLTGESITIAAPEQYTYAAEVDQLDFQRRGGSLPEDWYYLGSVPNTATPTTFEDKYPDDVIVANPSEGQDHYQLWPIIGAPVSGTGATVSGVLVEGSGFSTDWASDTPILINGVWYTIYQVYSSTSLQLYESAGNQTNVSWEIPEPILQGQPMPCFWGPLNETFFGCGDPINPQRLYWTNPGDADTTRQTNWLDITTPSEPLMNGVVYNGRCYIWSSERFFQVLPETQDESGAVVGWNYVEIPSGKGLWARWAFTNPQSIPGDVLFFLSKDGIYGTDGGSPSDITAEDLRPTFPNEGNVGETINGVPYPYIIPGANAHFRLSYYDDYLYFDYPDDTLAVVIPVSFTDDLNNWADFIASKYYNLGFSDSLNLWSDSLDIEVVYPGFDLQDSLNTWVDSIQTNFIQVELLDDASTSWDDAVDGGTA